MAFSGLPETFEMLIFASIVPHLRTSNVNVYVSKIYPSGLRFKGCICGRSTFIRDINWVSYLGGIYSGGFYTGGVLTGFYVILKFSLFLCNKRPIFYYVNSVCFETITYKVLIFFKNAIKVNQLRFSKNFPILKNRPTFFTSTVNILI